LIAILDIRDQLNIVSATSEWTKVNHPNGFPVWVHQDFIEVSDDIGVITGNSVNARSVPLITNGSIVGSLNKGETVTILDTREEWFRVMSPRHFHAWVKTDDFNRKTALAPPIEKQAEAQEETQESPKFSLVDNTSAELKPTTQLSDKEAENTHTDSTYFNDNDWLFGQESDHFTLQLASFSDPEKIAEFRSREKNANNNELYSFTSISKEKQWTYFIYGSYPSNVEAKESRDQIGEKLAWVRSFGKLQQNRCISWKKQIPAPKELNKYCS